MISKADLRSACRTLGLSERPVCVHSSLRSFGEPIEGGPDALIEVALSEGMTLVVPTFTYECEVAPPKNGWRERNGMRQADPAPELFRQRMRYSVDMSHVSTEMGSLPKAVLRRPERVRGDHPLDSFAAVGPLAGQIIRDQTAEDVYAPLRAAAGGFVLLIGVGLTRMTLIHMAEHLAGRELFRRWALRQDGEVIPTQVGGCSAGFSALEPVLEPLAQTHQVGASIWRAYPAAEVLSVAEKTIRSNPQITHCERAHCPRCDDAVVGGPLPSGDVHS